MNEINIDKTDGDYPYGLLLLADETKEGINKYLFDSEVYTAKTGKDTIGVFCLLPRDKETVEIMNIAVSEQYQNKGIGSRLLAASYEIAKEQGYKEVIVGTADCGIKQIRFYEKNGFVKYGIRKNYFTDIYDTPIYENGIRLKDMVVLRKIIIREIPKGDEAGYSPRLMAVWESSVKATHHFLKAEDFEFYKKLIPDYFPNVDLYVIGSGQTINAFMGVSGHNLEMLFVMADSRGKGYGKSLLMYALNELKVSEVDVNEQNLQAVGFYERFGFKVVARSEKDSTGKDYPILKMEIIR